MSRAKHPHLWRLCVALRPGVWRRGKKGPLREFWSEVVVKVLRVNFAGGTNVFFLFLSGISVVLVHGSCVCVCTSICLLNHNVLT